MKATFLTLLVVVALGAVAPAEAMTNARAGSVLAYVCATKAGTVKVATTAASCGPTEQAISLLTGDYKDLLASPGTINTSTNPIDWTQLKNVPPALLFGTLVKPGACNGDTLVQSIAGDGTIGCSVNYQEQLTGSCIDPGAMQAVAPNGNVTCGAFQKPLKSDCLPEGIGKIAVDGTVTCETDTALKSGTASFDVATGVGGSGIGYTDTATDGSLTGFFDPEIFHLVTNTKAFVIDTNSGSFGFNRAGAFFANDSEGNPAIDAATLGGQTADDVRRGLQETITGACFPSVTDGVIAIASNGSLVCAPPDPAGASVSAAAPLANTGGAISIPKAEATHDGYLAKEDFATFDGKQSRITGTCSDGINSVKVDGTVQCAPDDTSAGTGIGYSTNPFGDFVFTYPDQEASMNTKSLHFATGSGGKVDENADGTAKIAAPNGVDLNDACTAYTDKLVCAQPLKTAHCNLGDTSSCDAFSTVDMTAGSCHFASGGTNHCNQFSADSGHFGTCQFDPTGETCTGNNTISGNLIVTGLLSKAGGAFRIQNPLDSHEWLSHSFVESPDMMNVYNGNAVTDAKGFAVVHLPNYFQALNRDFRYQLTPIGREGWDARAGVWKEISDNTFTIRTDKPHVKVSWQVTGIRRDQWANAHRIKVIQPKS